MIAWNFQRIVGTCQFRVPWFGYPCGYSSLTLYQQTEKNDRLAAGYTLEEYERQYWQAFTDAVKVADPKWEAGKPIMPGVLDRITSKSIDALLVKSGSQLIRKSFERMI